MLAVDFDEEGLKKCSCCKNRKSKEEYYISKSHNCEYRSECIECGKANAKKFPKTPEQNRKCKLKIYYNLTLEDYNKMFKEQNGVCAICHEPETVKNRTGITSSLAVDHDHRTGKVRGLLCSECNKGIGSLKDNVEIILNAALYLEKYR